MATPPASATTLGRSPKSAIAPIVASSGPVARATGYTSERSPARYPALRVMKYTVCSTTATPTKIGVIGPSAGFAMTRIPIASGAYAIAPTTYTSQRNGVSAMARLVRRFQLAWMTADKRTSPSASELTAQAGAVSGRLPPATAIAVAPRPKSTAMNRTTPSRIGTIPTRSSTISPRMSAITHRERRSAPTTRR